jgi:hypothetical protein
MYATTMIMGGRGQRDQYYKLQEKDTNTKHNMILQLSSTKDMHTQEHLCMH